MSDRRRTGPMESIPPLRLPRFGERKRVEGWQDAGAARKVVGGPQNAGAPDQTASGMPVPLDATPRADPVRLARIKEILSASATGSAALKLLADESVAVLFVNSGGTYSDPTHRQIIVSTSQLRTAAEQAPALVHEAHHIRTYLVEHSDPDIRRTSRSEYVSKCLADEAGAMRDDIQTGNELMGSAWSEMMKQDDAFHPLTAQYNAAYEAAVTSLVSSNPKASAGVLVAAGELAGRDVLMKSATERRVTFEVGGEKCTNCTYVDYYGRYWDRAHSWP